MNETQLALTIVVLGVVIIAGFVRTRRSPSETAPPPADGPVTPADPSPPPLPPENIIQRMSEGVLVLDGQLKPTFFNAAARHMLGLRAVGPVERLPSDEVTALARKAIDSTEEIEDVIGLWFPTRSSLKVKVTPLENAGVLVLLRDVTDEVLAQRIRTEFVSHASHELKSPVAGLQALSEALTQALEDDPAAASRFAERMTAEATRLGRLIGDLLDLSRLEDPATIPDEPIELSDVAERELQVIETTARAKSMEVYDGVQPGVWVRGDDEQLALMVRNLLENAVRYTPEGGKVALEVQGEDSMAVLRVRDTGIGIPRESQGRIFERFYRVDRARSRDRGGTGLGLAIVKHVAELHGGEVLVESELGQGSTFTVTLPLLTAPQEPAQRAAG